MKQNDLNNTPNNNHTNAIFAVSLVEPIYSSCSLIPASSSLCLSVATVCNHILTIPLSKLDELNGETTLLDKTIYGVENSSTFLECSPKSQRAVIYWQYQQAADDHKREVGTPAHADMNSDKTCLWSR